MYPVPESRVKPFESAGEIEKTFGAVPPALETGRIPKPASVVPVVIATVAESKVVVTAGLTVNVKVLLEEVLTASVTVTVSTLAVRVSDGVPEIVPVVVSKLKPAGKIGVIEYCSGAPPPPPLTGLKFVERPTVRVAVAESCVVLRGPLILRVNTELLVEPFTSVTVTVSTLSLRTARGVPVI